MSTNQIVEQIASDIQSGSPLPDKRRFGFGGTPQTQTITMNADIVVSVTGMKLSEVNELRSTFTSHVNERFRSDVCYFSYIARCEITKVASGKKENTVVFSVKYTFSRQRQ